MEINSIFDEIKSKVPLEDEIEKSGVKLNRSGPNRMKGCCPIHNENTPSFMFYKGEEYDTFYCFGCKTGGNVIDFIKHLKKFSSYKQVVEYFSKNYSLEYSEKEKDLDEIFSEEFENKKRRNKVIYNYGISTSKIIQSYLKKCNEKELEFKRISPYLRALDSALYLNNMDQLKFHRESILDYIRECEKNDDRKNS
jgi:DNA primase